MNIIVLMAITLTISLILSEIFFRLKYPRVIGQILAGIVLGIPIIRSLFTTDNLLSIKFLAEIGIVFLLLLAGMEINLRKLEKASKDALLIAIFAALIPFALGFVVAKAFGYSTVISLVVGACLALTAEGTKLKVLIEMKILETKIGLIMLGAGILDDVFEILFLAVLLIYVHGSITHIALFPIMLIVFVIISFLIFKYVPKIIKMIHKERSRIATFSTILTIGLIIAALSQFFGLGPIIGAFIAGIIIQLANKNKRDEMENIKELKVMTFSLIIPFLFINIGLHFDFSSLLLHPLLLLLIVFVAIAGKLVGSIIVSFFSDLSFRQTMLIGWGMNSRGMVELIIAELARVNNLIPIEVYSVIVIMAISTTLIFPFALKYYVNKYPGIMTQ